MNPTSGTMLTADFMVVLAWLVQHLKARHVVTIEPVGACWECRWEAPT